MVLSHEDVAAILESHLLYLKSPRAGRQAEFTRAEISEFDFSDLDLTGIYAQDAVFERCRFRRTDFYYANFSGTIAPEGDFRDAVLAKAEFHNADLRGANFDGANLIQTFFLGCDLRGATFRGADLAGTCFSGSQMAGTIFEPVTEWTKVCQAGE